MAAIPISRFQIDVTELTTIYHILNLLNHRNKNQHRRNGWWKWFSMMRRAVGKLLQKREKNIDSLVKTHIAFMNNHLFPNCYVSFTQLLADGQFSALGLVLLAELARTRSAIGARDMSVGDVFSPSEDIIGRAPGPKMAMAEDIGEVLVRPHDSGNLELSAADAATTAGKPFDAPTTEPEGQDAQMKGMSSPPRLTPPGLIGPISDLHPGSSTSLKSATGRKQKKRRKLNPIDDLFEGLT